MPNRADFVPRVFTNAQPTDAVKTHMPFSTALQTTSPNIHSYTGCNCCMHLLKATDKRDGITYKGKDTGSALGVQADHPVAEHGKEEWRNHSHRHNIEQQHCSVVGWSAVCASIPLPAR
jgi:hypothetical protein